MELNDKLNTFTPDSENPVVVSGVIASDEILSIDCTATAETVLMKPVPVHSLGSCSPPPRLQYFRVTVKGHSAQLIKAASSYRNQT
jgi:hypothetical protein